MWFQKQHSQKERSVVLIGGTGAFGTLIAEATPPHTTLTTVSRASTLPPYAHSTALHADVFRDSPDEVLARVHARTGAIDVLVYAPFMSYYKPLNTMSKDELVHEFTLLSLFPILYAQSFKTYALKSPSTTPRIYIPVGSGVHKGTPTKRPDLGSYASCKAYLHESMRALSSPLFEAGIRTVQLHPGSLKDTVVRSRTKELFWKEVNTTDPDPTPYVVHEIY